MKKFNPPVSIQVYVGSGKKAEKIRDNMERARGEKSLSEFVMNMIEKANPSLFKGLEDAKA